MMNYEELGHKLKVERTKLKFKQDVVANEVGVGQRYLSKIEHGLARPEFEKVFKIAQMLGVSLVYLCTGGLFGVGVIVDLIILLFKPNPYYP